MKIVFVCASVDTGNAVVADTFERAKLIANHPLVQKLSIISLHGKNDFEREGIQVRCVGSDQKGKLATLWRFLSITYSVFKKENPTFYYFYMCPTLAPLLILNGVLFRTRVVQWFVHTQYRCINRFSLKYCTDLWFNTNESMAPFRVKHQHLVGHGIKADQFVPSQGEKKFDLITVSRITPVKEIERIIEAMKICRDQYGKKYSLNICGDAFVESDKHYRKKLEEMISQYQLENQVCFSGMVQRNELPLHYQQARLFVFTQRGGIGKVTLEGFACGVPTVTAWPEAKDFFGADLADWCLCERDPESIAMAMMRILEATEDVYKNLSQKCRQLFLDNYTMEKLIDRIIRITATEFGGKI